MDGLFEFRIVVAGWFLVEESTVLKSYGMAAYCVVVESAGRHIPMAFFSTSSVANL